MLLNDGEGTFEVLPAASPAQTSESTALGDVDGDGDLDSFDTSCCAVHLARNDGDGGFSSPEQVASVYPVTEVAAADLDGDGHLDLIAANLFTGIEVRLGDGSGAFGEPVTHDLGTAESYYVNELELVDLDDDGALDVVTSGLGNDAQGNQGFVGVMRGDGAGGFGPYALHPLSDRATNGPGLSFGDLDEDGHLDVLTGNTYVAALSFLAGDGDGGLAPQVEIPVPEEVHETALTDIDGDDHLDIVVTRWNKSSALVLFGAGDGSFSETHEVASGGRNAGSVEVGDLDGDGRSDLVISHAGSDGYTGSVGVALNRLRSRQH